MDVLRELAHALTGPTSATLLVVRSRKDVAALKLQERSNQPSLLYDDITQGSLTNVEVVIDGKPFMPLSGRSISLPYALSVLLGVYYALDLR
jgi:hypothetical protein